MPVNPKTPIDSHEGVLFPARRLPLFLKVYVFIALALGLLHFAIGANVLVIVLAVGTILISLLPTWLYGWRDMPALFCFLAGARYSGTALLAKALTLDPLDRGLYAPTTSFTVVAVGTSAAVVAAILAHWIWRGAPKFRDQYSRLGYGSLAALGGLFALLYTILYSSASAAPGGVMAFFRHGFVLLPLAWAVANLSVRRRLLTLGFVAGMATILLISLIFNSRQMLLYSSITIVAVIASYGVRLRFIPTAAALAGALFFAAYIAPALTDVRIYRQNVSTSDMFELTLDQIGARLLGKATDPWFDPKSPYQLDYLKNSNNFTDRFVNIQQLDFIVALAANQGPIGTSRFWASLWELLPAAIVADKSVTATPDYQLWIYGIFPENLETYTEVTPYGNAYSFGGMSFVFTAILPVFLLLFLFCRLACPTFRSSLLAAFIVATYSYEMTAGYLSTIYGIVLKQLPLEFLFFWIAARLSQPRLRAAAPSARGRASFG